MNITDLAIERKQGRPPGAHFYIESVEDKKASLEAGRAIMKDVDYVTVTAAYSKDTIIYKAEVWLEMNKQKVANGQMPREWAEHFERQYKAWKAGQELPVNGTPIKGWGVISPAMQKNIINVNILTVEDLAAANDEGLKRIGMGAQDLKNKANAWLAQLNDKGPLTIKMSAVEKENEVLKASIEALQNRINEFAAKLNAAETQPSEDAPAPKRRSRVEI